MKYFLHTIVMVLVGLSSIPVVFALTVSPAKLEISGDPGQTVSGEFKITNEQQETKTFYASFENFESSGETGVPSFIGANGGLATWIRTESKVTLNPGESKAIPFSVVIPKNTEPGGYFAAVFWGTQPPSAQGGKQVVIGAKLGILVLLRVSGQVKEAGGLLGFSAESGQRFFSMLPVAFSYRFNNTGGDRIVPSGDVAIRNLFSFNSATLSANIRDGSVLPDSIRKFEVAWNGNLPAVDAGAEPGFFEAAARQWNEFHFGWYTANLNLAWGTQNETATARYDFFIIPWQLLTLLAVLLALLGFGVKKYNHWVVEKAKSRMQ